MFGIFRPMGHILIYPKIRAQLEKMAKINISIKRRHHMPGVRYHMTVGAYLKDLLALF